jgi:hypothetical protein
MLLLLLTSIVALHGSMSISMSRNTQASMLPPTREIQDGSKVRLRCRRAILAAFLACGSVRCTFEIMQISIIEPLTLIGPKFIPNPDPYTYIFYYLGRKE